MNTAILGVGPVCALGAGVEPLRKGLRGELEPKRVDHRVDTGGEPSILRIYGAVEEGLDRFVPPRKLRRIDRFARMAMLASFLAVEDAGVDLEDRSRVGIVFGTGYGPLGTTFEYQDGIIDDGDRFGSPTAFSSSVHNAMAAQVSIALGLQGPCQTLTTFEQTTAGVFATAAAWLREGLADTVITGVGDEYHPVAGHVLLHRSRGFAGAVEPLAFDRCTYVPGEGFVTFLLGRGTGNGGRYPAVSRVVWSAGGMTPAMGLRGADRVFLAANGDPDAGTAYGKAFPPGSPVEAHAGLYGSLPVGLGFETAFAALFPTGVTACVQCEGGGSSSAVILEG